ncbi:Uncharacterised protein [Mycobacteroides abscessus subsp. abscessus]|nr:Uncharacterised protein [Mycobacteroides abscessus subsp. abscessus]SKX61316.1 Uncharacterised protein [Mycobacteroides abscessus subsp. abscessus]
MFSVLGTFGRRRHEPADEPACQFLEHAPQHPMQVAHTSAPAAAIDLSSKWEPMLGVPYRGSL